MTHRGPFQPRPFCDSVILCTGENQQKKLYEIQFGVWYCPKLAALTGAAQCRDETRECIKTSETNDTNSPHSVIYFSLVLLKK